MTNSTLPHGKVNNAMNKVCMRGGKVLVLMMLLLSLTLGVKANPVDMRLAREVGAKFINANTATRVASSSDLQLVTTYRTSTGVAAFHVFNMPQGWVIVAADDCATPILGYSETGQFDESNLPPTMEGYLMDFVEQIGYGIESHLPALDTVAQQWELVQVSGFLKDDRATTAVAPLLTTEWGQGYDGYRYNIFCPTDSNGPNGHAITGCVATAMGQVMCYWQYPQTGSGSHSYTPSNYPSQPQTVNFGNTTYDWNNMPNYLTPSSTTTQNNAVAKLLWHCGVSVDMDYGPDGSGAVTAYAVDAMRDYFNYSADLHYDYRSDYTNTQWINKLKADLNNGRPVLYNGRTPDNSSGHAFVCDGYNSSNQLHFNWGWYGQYQDTYFALDALTPGSHNYSAYNGAIFDIYPSCTSGTYFQVSSSTSPSYGGTVYGAGSYSCGSGCTLTAVPYDGYMFCSWTENGVLISTEPTYSFTVLESRNLVANFVSGDGCTLVFNLNDSFGDGWNGNALTVSYSSGCNSYEELTLESGSSSTITRNVVDGSHIVLGWISGNWISECSFSVSYENGTVIYEGSNLSSSFSYGFDVNCGGTSPTPPPSPTLQVVAEYYPEPNNSNSEYVRVYWTEPGSGESFYYNFDDGVLPAGWTTIDTDGDGNGWMFATEKMGSGYGHNASEDCMLSQSYDNSIGALTPDNYLVSEQVTITNGSHFSFYACAQDNAYAAEHFGVYVSLGNQNNFQEVQSWTMTAKNSRGRAIGGDASRGGGTRAQGNWYYYDVDLSAYTGTGYIAIRHYGCTDMFYLDIDDVAFGVGRSDRSTYRVYRDSCGGGEAQMIADNITGNQYIDYGWSVLSPGNYKYGVSVVDGRGNASEIHWNDTPVTPNYHTIDASAFLNPVINNNNLGEPSRVNYDNGWLYYDNGTYSDAIGTGGGTVYWGIMIPASSLTAYAGTNLTEIALYENPSLNTDAVTTYIYLDGSTAPGTLMSTQTFNPTGSEGFHEVTLDTPVGIDGTQNLWIVFSEYGTYPATGCTDTGDANGRWISLDGTSWEDVASYGLNYTWMIRGYVEEGGGTEISWSNCIEKPNSVTYYSITATANPSNGGTVYGADVYAGGQVCTLIATANSGYSFTSWILNGVEVSTDATYSFVVTESADYVANFTANTPPSPTLQVVAEYYPDVNDPNSPYVRVHWGAGMGNLENFETGDFSMFSWQVDPTYPWSVTTTNSYEGNYCMKSGNTGVASSTSSMSVTVAVPANGDMSFFGKISSESNWDYGYFYIDGVQMGSYTGNGNWVENIFTITAGEHTFTWQYTKDSSVNSNDDCFYVDYISFYNQHEPAQPGWHTYCESEFNNAVGSSLTNTPSWAYEYPVTFLHNNYAGWNITKVSLFSDDMYGAVGGNYTCRIYVGGNEPAAGTMVSELTVDVPSYQNAWVDWDLTTPVNVTGNDPIWVVWTANTTVSSWPAGCCGDLNDLGTWWEGGNGWEHLTYGTWTMRHWFANRAGRSVAVGTADNANQVAIADANPLSSRLRTYKKGDNEVYTVCANPNAVQGTAIENGTRRLNHYRVYRANCDGTEMQQIADNVAENQYIDTEWTEMVPGNYKYGVSIVSNGREGAINWVEPVSANTQVHQPLTPEKAEAMGMEICHASSANSASTGSREMWDLMATFYAAEGGHYGVAYDGDNFYTSNWGYSAAAHNFYKYDLQGNVLEGFEISGCGTLRGITYDGTYFYGVANSSTVYCVDLANHSLISTFTSSYGAMRGITYDPVRDGFWVIGNWSGNLTLIDRTGAIVEVGPEPTSASDLAYYKDENNVEHVYCFNNGTNDVDDWVIGNTTMSGSVFNFSNTPGYDSGSSGGCTVGNFNGKMVFIGDIQQSPNLIGIYELGEGYGQIFWSNCIEKTINQTYYSITATANPSNGGTVTGAGPYLEGTTCTLIATPNEGYTFTNWTKDGVEVSTNATYSFTVTENASYVANFSSGGNHWGVDIYQYPYNMSVTGIIQIYGEEQQTTALEIGAFCGDVCRGTQRLTYFPQVNRYLVFLTLYGDAGDVMSFRLYDHSLGEELDLSCNSTITFVPDGFMGTPFDPYVFDFGNLTVDQVTNFSEGYNWWSTYIEQEGIDGMGMLQEGLGGNGISIRSQASGYTDYYTGYGWFGSLTSIDNESSYRVITSAPCSVTMTGNLAVPSEHPVTLSQGWTWIGYVPSTEMDINAAMSGMTPASGDKLKSQQGYADYYVGYGWFGSLATIEPGMGLMYYSTSSTPVTFTYPDNAKGGEPRANLTAENNHWVPNTFAYPDNMTVMAVVDLDDEELASDSYELAAFANGECRGSVKLIFAEPLNHYVAFLTVSGKDAAELSFRLYDTETGKEYYDAEESLTFTANAIVGDADNLFTIHFRGATGMDEFANSVRVYPNPVNCGENFSIGLDDDVNNLVRVEIVNALGVVVETVHAPSVQTLTAPNVAGVYTLRITVEGKGTLVRKLVVK